MNYLWSIACDSNDMLYFIQINPNRSKIMNIAICLFLVSTLVNAVEFILKPNIPTCTVLISSFDVCYHSFSQSKSKPFSLLSAASNRDKGSKSHSLTKKQKKSNKHYTQMTTKLSAKILSFKAVSIVIMQTSSIHCVSSSQLKGS